MKHLSSRSCLGFISASLAAAVPAHPALAQADEVAECRSAMAEQWGGLVRAPMPGEVAAINLGASQPRGDAQEASDLFRGELEALATICADDRAARNDILLLDAMRSRDLQQVDRALALLDRVEIGPEDRSFALYQAERLKAHSQAGKLAEIWPQVLDTHEARLLAAGMQVEPPFTVQGVHFRAYRLADPEAGWLLIGLYPDGGLETILAGVPEWARGYAFEGDAPPLGFTNFRCSTSNAPIDEGGRAFDDALTLADIIGLLDTHYRDQEGARTFGHEPNIPDFCPNLGEMLPGFGRLIEFTGVEYRDRSRGYSEEELLAGLYNDDPGIKLEAVDYLFDHPQLVEPFQWIYGITALLERGDMERATFWYFIWQTRTRPWMAADSTMAQVRGAIVASLGPILLEWAGSDYAAMLELWRRAIRHELKLPLYAGTPPRMSAREWERSVAAAREENSEANMLGDFPAQAEYEASRRRNGLAVGPWAAPGRPLKDEWR